MTMEKISSGLTDFDQYTVGMYMILHHIMDTPFISKTDGLLINVSLNNTIYSDMCNMIHNL